MQRDIENIIFENTPKIQELAHICETNTAIDKELYTKYEVKRGLRDLNGKGVLAGLTNISDIVNTKVVDGKDGCRRLAPHPASGGASATFPRGGRLISFHCANDARSAAGTQSRGHPWQAGSRG